MEATMSREYAKVIARAWIDPVFKERLMQDPASVFAEHGIDAPAIDAQSFTLPFAPVDLIQPVPTEGVLVCPGY